MCPLHLCRQSLDPQRVSLRLAVRAHSRTIYLALRLHHPVPFVPITVPHTSPCAPDIAQGIADLYNEVVASLVPRCYPVATAQLAFALRVTCGGPSEDPLLHSESAFVAMDDGIPAGFVHVAVGRNNKNESGDHGQIRLRS